MAKIATPAEVDLAALIAVRAELGDDSAASADADNREWLMGRFDTFLRKVRTQAERERRAMDGPSAPDAPRVARPPDIAAALASTVTSAPPADASTHTEAGADEDGFEEDFWRDDSPRWNPRLRPATRARIFQGAGIAALVIALLLRFG